MDQDRFSKASMLNSQHQKFVFSAAILNAAFKSAAVISGRVVARFRVTIVVWLGM